MNISKKEFSLINIINLNLLQLKYLKKDGLIKMKFSFDLLFLHLINITMPIDTTFREVRRRTNPIGCFENVKSADKILALIVEHINVELFGNASFINI